MNKTQLTKMRDFLGFTTLEFGKEVGYKHSKYQCKQMSNLLNGTSDITPMAMKSIECLFWRRGRIEDFNRIMNDSSLE